VAAALREAGCDVPLRDLAVPQRFLDHGSRDDVLAALGLTAQDVARRVTEWAAAAGPADAEVPAPGAAPSDLTAES
jgi:1-deoxy-D-xylulose-5-phosphate synthase